MVQIWDNCQKNVNLFYMCKYLSNLGIVFSFFCAFSLGFSGVCPFSPTNEIAVSIYDNQNKIRNRGLVPMNEVLKYFNIDLNYLQKIVTLNK